MDRLNDAFEFVAIATTLLGCGSLAVSGSIEPVGPIILAGAAVVGPISGGRLLLRLSGKSQETRDKSPCERHENDERNKNGRA
jgi:hypothetical protein